MATEGGPPLKDVVESLSQSRSESRSGSRSASRSRTPPARDTKQPSKPSKDAKRIWIGGLPDRINEEDLREIFESFGEIDAVNIRSSKVDTFAFIEFKDTEAASRATKEVDQSFIRGNRVKCHWAQLKDEEPLRKNRINQIWIGHLKENDEDALQDAFEKFGRIRSLKIRSNRADLFAFIEYETPEACDDACAEMNGKEFLGGEIRVAWAQEKSTKKLTPRRAPRGRSYERRPGRYRSRSPDRRFRRSRSPRGRGRGTVPRGDYKLEIENIPHEMSWMDLKTLGRDYGGARSVTFARTWTEGKTCMGELEFTSKSALRATMDSLHGHRINGQKVYCRAL